MSWKLIYIPEKCAGCDKEFREGELQILAVTSNTGKVGTYHYPDCVYPKKDIE
jgi:hypothetical protein